MKFIPVAEPYIDADELLLVTNCVKSTWISSAGEYIDKFETSFARYFGVKYAISSSNGTTALHLALLALDIGPGDEVIVPTFTFVASVNAIKYVGATPVFVDIDPKTWTLDPQKVEKKITRKTKAVMPVHLYGYPANMHSIKKMARIHKLLIIEDAAEAHTAKYANEYVGTIGDVGCFSFYGNKIITTGEGGMLTTNSTKIRNKILLLKNHGMSPKKRYFHPIIGYNYRMTNLQAALGLGQMKKLTIMLQKRKKIEQLYRKHLGSIPNIVFQPKQDHISHVCWLFSILIKPYKRKNRNTLIRYLKKHNIDSRPFFYMTTDFPMYKSTEDFPVSKEVSSQGINLPTSPRLTDKQISYICNKIKKHLTT